MEIQADTTRDVVPQLCSQQARAAPTHTPGRVPATHRDLQHTQGVHRPQTGMYADEDKGPDTMTRADMQNTPDMSVHTCTCLYALTHRDPFAQKVWLVV